MNWLDKIIANKRDELVRWKAATPYEALKDRAALRAAPPDFRTALTARPVGLIAEVKRRSPSAGVIRDPFDPPAIARSYEQGGAQALSVLMDEQFFGGGAHDFSSVRSAVALPMLYKEFVVDPWQVWQAAALGASAVLLIVSALSLEELAMLMQTIDQAGLQALVEVHDEAEADVAAAAGAMLIGVNNRNLKTFVTDLETTARVRARIPADRLCISESGIRNAADVVHLKGLGANAVLVGEHLLRKPDPGVAARELMEPAWMSS